MDKDGKVIARPAGMSDEDWQAKLKAEGLVELKGADAQRFRQQAEQFNKAKSMKAPANRHERRARASLARRGKL